MGSTEQFGKPAQTICEGVDGVGIESVWVTGKLIEMLMECVAGAEGSLSADQSFNNRFIKSVG